MLATARLGTGWISSCIAATCFEEAPFELWAKSQCHKEATGGQQQQCKVLLNFKISESTDFFVGLFVTILSLLELSYISTLNTKVRQLASTPSTRKWHWKGTKSSKVKKTLLLRKWKKLPPRELVTGMSTIVMIASKQNQGTKLEQTLIALGTKTPSHVNF